MRREEAAAIRSGRLYQPCQRVDHQLLRVARALEELGTMPVRRVLLLAAVSPRDERPGDRRQRAASRNDLVENDHADVQPRAQRLRLGDVPEVFVSDLVREYCRELTVIG